MKCDYCSYEWKPRTKKPLACPRCHRYLEKITSDRKSVRCLKCGYEWKPLLPISKVKECARCKNRGWNDMLNPEKRKYEKQKV